MAKKKLSVVLIPRKTEGVVHEAYVMLDEIVAAHHPELAKHKCKIALAWNLSWSADADGRLVLGKCKKGADLERQMHGFDFVILLNQERWLEWVKDFGGEKYKRALIDHELCHAAVKEDKDGNVVKDEQGRTVYRIRKHDLEEFREIVDRHGIWKSDIAAFAKSCMEQTQTPLLSEVKHG